MSRLKKGIDRFFRPSGTLSRKRVAGAIIAGLAILVLAVGSDGSESKTPGANARTSVTESAKRSDAAKKHSGTKRQQTTFESGLELTVDSVTAADGGVTMNLSYNGSDTDWASVTIERFEFDGKAVSVRYDPEYNDGHGRYAADGLGFLIDSESYGETSESNLISMQGGTKSTVKFVVDGFTKAEDYDGFTVYFDESYNEILNSEFKDTSVQVHVS